MEILGLGDHPGGSGKDRLEGETLEGGRQVKGLLLSQPFRVYLLSSCSVPTTVLMT